MPLYVTASYHLDHLYRVTNQAIQNALSQGSKQQHRSDQERVVHMDQEDQRYQKESAIKNDKNKNGQVRTMKGRLFPQIRNHI